MRRKYKVRKIEVSLPIRINFGGAWSDTPPFCINEGGLVCSASANINGKRPINVTIEEIADEKIIIENDRAKLELKEIEPLEKINLQDEFALFKIILDLVQIRKKNFKLRVNCSDIPKGSGLGTSSIVALAVLKALYQFEEREIDIQQLINQVLEVERRIGTGGGWQDQAGAVESGVKILTSNPGNYQEVKIKKIKMPIDAQKELQKRLLLIYTGETRNSKEIVHEIMGKYQNDVHVRDKICQLKEIALQMEKSLKEGDIGKFSELLNQNYELSKTLNNKIENRTTRKIFEMIDDLIDGKMICGAGNGGFIEVILKKGIEKEELQLLLDKCFPNSLVKVWKVEIDF